MCGLVEVAVEGVGVEKRESGMAQAPVDTEQTGQSASVTTTNEMSNDELEAFQWQLGEGYCHGGAKL
jgi:hypothetical protein